MKTQNKHLLVALICGAAAGAALGVLFAPASASKVRKTLTDDTLWLKKLFSTKINEVADMVYQVKDGLANKLS